jgi:hypothetical protein
MHENTKDIMAIAAVTAVAVGVTIPVFKFLKKREAAGDRLTLTPTEAVLLVGTCALLFGR